MRSGLVTLLTDFGDRDPYAGIMKGVLLGLHPEATLVDLTHHVRPQDVAEAAFLLATAVDWFPEGTVHLAVVDPGVGSARRALVVRGRRHLYVAPDNGLLTLAFRRDPPQAVHEVRPGRWTLPVVSSTFHGRDIFAPAAAWLARGREVEDLGPAVEDPVLFEFAPNRYLDGRVETAVVHVDGFGNAVTGLHEGDLAGRSAVSVRVAGRSLPVRRTYADAGLGELLALWGSAGFLEVSENRGNAARALDLEPGSSVTVFLESP